MKEYFQTIRKRDFVEILKKNFACRAFIPADGHIATAIKKIMFNSVSQSRILVISVFFIYQKTTTIDRFSIPNFFFHNDLSQTNGKMSFRTGEFLQGNVWLGGCLAPTPLTSPAPAPQTTDYYLKIFGSR